MFFFVFFFFVCCLLFLDLVLEQHKRAPFSFSFCIMYLFCSTVFLVLVTRQNQKNWHTGEHGQLLIWSAVFYWGVGGVVHVGHHLLLHLLMQQGNQLKSTLEEIQSEQMMHDKHKEKLEEEQGERLTNVQAWGLDSWTQVENICTRKDIWWCDEGLQRAHSFDAGDSETWITYITTADEIFQSILL